jgi:hypothetical protein
MATEKEIRDLAGKALGDPDFRKKLMDDPEGAFAEAGVELAPEQLEALKGMDSAEMEESLTNLDERLTMACWGKAQPPIIGPICGWD